MFQALSNDNEMKLTWKYSVEMGPEKHHLYMVQNWEFLPEITRRFWQSDDFDIQGTIADDVRSSTAAEKRFANQK